VKAPYAFNADTASIEFGLSIDDRWQGHGIGKACSGIWNAVPLRSGAERLFGDTRAPTTPMIGLARKSGYAFHHSPGLEAGAFRETDRRVEPRISPAASWRLAAFPVKPTPAPRRGFDKLIRSGCPETGLFSALNIVNSAAILLTFSGVGCPMLYRGAGTALERFPDIARVRLRTIPIGLSGRDGMVTISPWSRPGAGVDHVLGRHHDAVGRCDRQACDVQNSLPSLR